MKQEFILEGLDCAHCAAKIEAQVRKLEGVQEASLNFMKQRLTLEAERSMEKQVRKLVKQLEPDVQVRPVAERSAAVHQDQGTARRWWRLLLGALVMAVGLWVRHSLVRLPLLVLAYGILGYDVLWKAVRNLFRGRLLDENFLMSLSTVGAFAIGEYPEAVAVMLLYQLGELFQDMAVQRSRRSVAQLMDLRPESVSVWRHGSCTTVPPEEVAVDEIIQVLPGQKIPLDAVVLEGNSVLDTRAITGESVPRPVCPGDQVVSGCVNLQGALKLRVARGLEESTVSKILDLVENASASKAPAENFITTFARYYTPVVVLLAALLAVLPPLITGGSWIPWLRRSFVFLVVSCPCALVISVPLTFFGGIGAASRRGILVKGSNYLQALTRLDTVVFDKTGTLTKGAFKVERVEAAPGFTDREVLEYAARAECHSGHPIARSILEACPTEPDPQEAMTFQEQQGMGLSVEADGKQLLAGSADYLRSRGIDCVTMEAAGTKVYVAVDGVYAGCILIADGIKTDSAQSIRKLKELGIRKTVMLTGDDTHVAKSVAETLGLDSWHARLLPQDKVERLERLCSEKGSGRMLAFVGDGVNDAPVLARADVGIAMGALGSDAAIEAADVVLMTDEPSKLVEAIQIAKATRQIVIQNILFALTVKGICLLLGALGIAGMWTAVFADVGVTLLAVLNGLRMLRK